MSLFWEGCVSFPLINSESPAGSSELCCASVLREGSCLSSLGMESKEDQFWELVLRTGNSEKFLIICLFWLILRAAAAHAHWNLHCVVLLGLMCLLTSMLLGKKLPSLVRWLVFLWTEGKPGRNLSLGETLWFIHCVRRQGASSHCFFFSLWTSVKYLCPTVLSFNFFAFLF